MIWTIFTFELVWQSKLFCKWWITKFYKLLVNCYFLCKTQPWLLQTTATTTILPQKGELLSVKQQPRLLNGQVDIICHDNHSSLSLRAPLASCELWSPCCHHLPWQPLDAVLKPEPALDIARLDVPAPVTAQFEQTEVLCDWFNADTVFHILIQKKSNIILISENYPIVKVSFFQYTCMSVNWKVNVNGCMYKIHFMRLNLRANCLTTKSCSLHCIYLQYEKKKV